MIKNTKKIIHLNIVKYIFLTLTFLLIGSCVYINDEIERSNPADVIYENNINGELIRLVLTAPVKDLTQLEPYTLTWASVFAQNNDYLSVSVVLYQKVGLFDEADLITIKANTDLTANGYTKVTPIIEEEFELTGYTGTYSFVLGFTHPTVANKIVYSNVVTFSF